MNWMPPYRTLVVAKYTLHLNFAAALIMQWTIISAHLSLPSWRLYEKQACQQYMAIIPNEMKSRFQAHPMMLPSSKRLAILDSLHFNWASHCHQVFHNLIDLGIGITFVPNKRYTDRTKSHWSTFFSPEDAFEADEGEVLKLRPSILSLNPGNSPSRGLKS